MPADKVERGDVVLQPNSNSSQIEVSNENPNFGTDKVEIPVLITSRLAVNTQYTATSPSSWITELNPSSGTLQPNKSVALSIKIDRNSKALSTGVNTGVITFVTSNSVSIPPITVTVIK